MNEIDALFREYTGEETLNRVELPSSGSNRRYFRVSGRSRTLIAVRGTSAEENRAFWELARHFRARNLPVPEVYAHSDDFLCYLQQDLGNEILYDRVAAGREKGAFSAEEKSLLTAAIRALPALQFRGAEGLDFSVCYPQPAFDRQMIAFDQNYFKYCFLKATGLEFNEIKLEEDFGRMAETLLREAGETFLYRDFQARNVMLVDNQPYFIDFQGGRKGPIYYDVASFVWQAKANYSETLKAELIDAYLDALSAYQTVDRAAFLKTLRHFVLFRILQTLGAYGFRGYFEKKPHFLQSIPFAMDNLRRLLAEPFAEYPYLNDLLGRLVSMQEFAHPSAEQLEVSIYSFAYKKGIPNDPSGNGGGYVFDCRAINNPGKYEHYRHFTGLDAEVIRFLEEDGGAKRFLDHVRPLAQAHVERYIERKFTNLMISFGCTGGQHRSVYCAQRLAEHIAALYPVRVHLYHRELGMERHF